MFSGIWLALAIIRPRYGRRISNDSRLPPSTASLLCAAFSKSIELSFTTVFVAFLGQVLSRRAFAKKSKGITIAEMSMRSWIMQPGTLMTHWENVGHAAFTLLGSIALIAALMAMVYTTASDALGEWGFIYFYCCSSSCGPIFYSFYAVIWLRGKVRIPRYKLKINSNPQAQTWSIGTTNPIRQSSYAVC